MALVPPARLGRTSAPRRVRGASRKTSRIYPLGRARPSAARRRIGPALRCVFASTEFRAKTTYGTLANANLLDWPVSYAELEPYYERAEKKMGVTRTNSERRVCRATTTSKSCTTARPRSATRNAARATWRSTAIFATGAAAACSSDSASRAANPGAKWSTLYTEIPRAEATGLARFTAGVDKCCTSSTIRKGKVSGVVYVDAAGTHAAPESAAGCGRGVIRSKPRGCC